MMASDLEVSSALAPEVAWCAGVMASTDPWITLGRDYDACLARLQTPGLNLLVARRGGAPLGFILLHPTGVAGSPYIASVAVAVDARGMGVGSALVAHAEGYYPNVRHMFLCVSAFNTAAQRLYRRLGYREVGRLPDYVMDGADELLMHKRLVHR